MLADTPSTQPPRFRIEWIDVARGVALIAMAVYHFAWDLEFFGYAAPGMTAVGGWKMFARCIASTFLFLVGVSLFLAHARGVRWPGFSRRLAMVAGAALLISVATWFATPNAFIFFGILHQIALASLLGLLFLRVPTIATLAVAAFVIAAPHYLRSEFFDHPALWWVGLSPINPRSNDYVPLFPWFGAVLIGIAAAKLAERTGSSTRLAGIDPGNWSKPLRFAGRHSLAFYLIHQPVLIACVWLFSQVFPATPMPPETRFSIACERSCAESRDAAFCVKYCACMHETLVREKLFDQLYSEKQDPDLQRRVQDFAAICTAETDTASEATP